MGGTTTIRNFNFQRRVDDWMVKCFGREIADNLPERNHRFLEEALELVQSANCTREEAHMLVDYVFDRPVGETFQEIGGAMLTLSALCNALSWDMQLAAEAELSRVLDPRIIAKIQAKQATKPQSSPLPGIAPGALFPPPQTHETVIAERPWRPWIDMPVGNQRNVVREVRSEDGRTALAYWTGKFMALAPVSDEPVELPFKVSAQRPPPQDHLVADRLEELTKQRDHFRDQWRACWAPLTPRSENEKQGLERVLAILKSKLSDGGGIVGPSDVQRAHNDFYRGRRVAFEECATMLRAALATAEGSDNG